MLAHWMTPVMNAALVLGVGAVLPLSLRRKPAPWAAAAVGVVVALSLPAGRSAALFVTPWVVLTVVAGVDALLRRDLWPAAVAGS